MEKNQSDLEKKVKKYFKQELDKIKTEENLKQELDKIKTEEKSHTYSIVDEILDNEYKKSIQLTIKSRSKLIEKCDYMFNKWKEHFARRLKSELRINRSENTIFCDDSYSEIPKRLEEYLNDTYDNEKRRIRCYLKDFSTDYDSLFVEILSGDY